MSIEAKANYFEKKYRGKQKEIENLKSELETANNAGIALMKEFQKLKKDYDTLLKVTSDKRALDREQLVGEVNHWRKETQTSQRIQATLEAKVAAAQKLFERYLYLKEESDPQTNAEVLKEEAEMEELENKISKELQLHA